MMKTKKIIVVLFICLLGSVLGFSLVASAAPQETQLTHLMRQPDISKDNVVFSYAGDLWIVPRAGGQARRLTSHPGDELFPKFSPDGKWIAFTGEYDGNPDVYVMPAQGGEPKRLTYHPGNDIVLGWTPDGKKILFRSNQASAPPPTTQPLPGFASRRHAGHAAGTARRPDQFFSRRPQDRLPPHLAGIPHLEALSRRLEPADRHLRSRRKTPTKSFRNRAAWTCSPCGTGTPSISFPTATAS